MNEAREILEKALSQLWDIPHKPNDKISRAIRALEYQINQLRG